jgi:hypothetical protein
MHAADEQRGGHTQTIVGRSLGVARLRENPPLKDGAALLLHLCEGMRDRVRQRMAVRHGAGAPVYEEACYKNAHGTLLFRSDDLDGLLSSVLRDVPLCGALTRTPFVVTHCCLGELAELGAALGNACAHATAHGETLKLCAPTAPMGPHPSHGTLPSNPMEPTLLPALLIWQVRTERRAAQAARVRNGLSSRRGVPGAVGCVRRVPCGGRPHPMGPHPSHTPWDPTPPGASAVFHVAAVHSGAAWFYNAHPLPACPPTRCQIRQAPAGCQIRQAAAGGDPFDAGKLHAGGSGRGAVCRAFFKLREVPHGSQPHPRPPLPSPSSPPRAAIYGRR